MLAPVGKTCISPVSSGQKDEHHEQHRRFIRVAVAASICAVHVGGPSGVNTVTW